MIVSIGLSKVSEHKWSLIDDMLNKHGATNYMWGSAGAGTVPLELPKNLFFLSPGGLSAKLFIELISPKIATLLPEGGFQLLAICIDGSWFHNSKPIDPMATKDIKEAVTDPNDIEFRSS